MMRCRSAMSCGRVTSVAMKRVFAPVAAPISATAFSPSTRRRPAITTSAPRRAKASAAARPIPVAPPVTSTTLSAKSRIGNPGALDDGALIQTRRQAAIGSTSVVAQPRGAERIGHGGWRLSDEQAGLQGDCHLLDDSPRPRLVLLRRGELRLELGDHAIEAPIAAFRTAHLVEEGRHALRRAAGGAQHVEGDDVAAALPDAV